MSSSESEEKDHYIINIFEPISRTFISWTFKKKGSAYDVGVFTATFYTAKAYQKKVTNPKELFELANVDTADKEGETSERDGKYYVKKNNQLFWMYEGKYLVSVYNWNDYSDTNELFLLSEDLIFKKHQIE